MNKAKSLLTPYFFWGIVCFIIWYISSDEKSMEPLTHLLWINTEGLKIAGALWFLTAYFISELIFYGIRCIKNETASFVIALLIALFGCILPTLLPTRLPWAMDAGFVGVGFMEIGYLCRQKQGIFSRVMDMRVWQWILSALVTTVLIFVNGYINMRQGTYAIIPLFWLNAILAIGVGLSMCKFIEKKIPQKYWKWFAACGRNSMVFLCLNQLVIQIVREAVIRPLGVTSPIKTPLIFILTWATLMILMRVFQKTKLNCLMGR